MFLSITTSDDFYQKQYLKDSFFSKSLFLVCPHQTKDYLCSITQYQLYPTCDQVIRPAKTPTPPTLDKRQLVLTSNTPTKLAPNCHKQSSHLLVYWERNKLFNDATFDSTFHWCYWLHYYFPLALSLSLHARETTGWPLCPMNN